MKTLKIMLLLLAWLSFAPARSQVNVNVNFGSPPAWGPPGYTEVRYYYLPDLQMYYDVNVGQFIYWGGSNWVYSYSLPARYRYYDLYAAPKIVLTNYYGPTPYRYISYHRVKYPVGYKPAVYRKAAYDHKKKVTPAPNRIKQNPGKGNYYKQKAKPKSKGKGNGKK